ncbi:MAG: FliI/YscN family ATPase [Mariprofundaceae bacterium]
MAEPAPGPASPLASLLVPELRRPCIEALEPALPFHLSGRIHKVQGPMIEAGGLDAGIGQVCDVIRRDGSRIEAEIVGFRDRRTLLMPVGATTGIAPGDRIESTGRAPATPVGESLLGRVLDGASRPLDDRPLPTGMERRPLHAPPPNPLDRHVIDSAMQTGVRVLDTCLPIGHGQRIGLFAGAGVGKSSLMGMLARHSSADVHVIALVGERSREVREFLEDAMGSEAMRRSIVVVATSDAPPVLRLRAALTATTIAEHFRDAGRQVLLMMDSLTRFAQAQREIGLMLGEPPASKGYTPSCFARLAELLERAGPGTGAGDITAIYTILVEGDEPRDDPVADAAMAVLDGHVLLDRRLAERGHYPAVNILASVSRLTNRLLPGAQLQILRNFRRAMAARERVADLIDIGAYEPGANPEVDRWLAIEPEILRFLQQPPDESTPAEEAARKLLEIVRRLKTPA